jgi:hypothetical protein
MNAFAIVEELDVFKNPTLGFLAGSDRWHCERVGLKIGNFLSEKRYTSQKQMKSTLQC